MIQRGGNSFSANIAFILVVWVSGGEIQIAILKLFLRVELVFFSPLFLTQLLIKSLVEFKAVQDICVYICNFLDKRANTRLADSCCCLMKQESGVINSGEV